jgi:regulator of replication initiation timing
MCSEGRLKQLEGKLNRIVERRGDLERKLQQSIEEGESLVRQTNLQERLDRIVGKQGRLRERMVKAGWKPPEEEEKDPRDLLKILASRECRATDGRTTSQNLRSSPWLRLKR